MKRCKEHFQYARTLYAVSKYPNIPVNTALDSFPTTTDLVHEDLHLNYTLLHLDTVGDGLVVEVDGGVTLAPQDQDTSLSNETDVTAPEGILGVGGHTPILLPG